MGKKILVGFDDSENAMRAVDFIATTIASDSDVTLFFIESDTATLCRMNSPELGPYFKSQQQSFCSLEDKKRKLVEESMQKAKHLLVEAGFNTENVRNKIQTRKKGIARDIVKEAQDGYDVIVMGRRGISAIKDFLLGSVSQKVFNAAKNVSILIVD